MSSDKECLLVEEDYALPEDLNCHQESCNHRDQAYPSFEAEYGCDDRPDHPEAQTVSRLFSAYYFTLHLVCVLLAVSLFFTTTRHCGNHPDLAMLGTWDYDNRYPDWVPVSYELQREDALDQVHTEFSGMPDNANTKAWDDLITPTFFAASQQDLEKIGESVNDSVPLADGGYMVGLSVYHNIHCLRRLRLFLHSNYYYENLTEENIEYLRGHLGHCIESLRRSIMCNADVNSFSFTWEDAELVRPNVWRPRPKSNQERKCVRWEAIQDWVMQRHVPLNPVLLKPGGEEEKILMV